MRSSDGNSILVYLSHSSANVAINMYRFTAGSTVQARWYNPTNGQYTTIGDYSNSGVQWFATPGGWQDAVLVLETPSVSSPPSLTAAPGKVAPGGTVTVSWAAVSGATVADWIGLYPQGAADEGRLDWRFTSSCAYTPGGTAQPSGSYTLTMPLTPGTYEFRLFANNSFSRLATSGTVMIPGGGGGGGPGTLTVSPDSVGRDGVVTVSWTGSSSPTDWIGRYSAGVSDGSYEDWKFTSTCAQSAAGGVASSGSCTFTMPSEAGPYEFRLFATVSYSRLATSNTVTVTGGGGGGGNGDAPTLTVNPAATGPGGIVTVSWSGGGSAVDWISCYSADGGNAFGWFYTSSCAESPGGSAVPSGSCTFTMPIVIDSYQFRLYSNGGFEVLAKSPIVIVH